MTEKRVAGQARFVGDTVVEAVLLMVGLPDYRTYVTHQRTRHPGQPIMTYREFFQGRQSARHAVGKGRFRGGC